MRTICFNCFRARPKVQLLEAMMEMRQGAEASRLGCRWGFDPFKMVG